jgi:hypothetical protein
MAKKIDIGSKEFSKAIEGLPYIPNQKIVKRLDSKMFSLDANNVFNYKPEYLGAKEFKSACELFQRRFGSNVRPTEIRLKVLGLFEFIARQEAPFVKDLQKIAVDTIRELYNVPGHVNLQAFIEPRINLDTEQDNDPKPFLELTLEQKNAMRDEIQKRIILNGLVHGSSMHIWKGVYYLVKEKLDEMNPVLIQLYDEFTAGINFEFWMMNPDAFQDAIEGNTQITQGFNQIKFDQPGKPEANVLCKAINFPSLLHEVNKGVIDYLICHSIPKQYSEDELQYYYNKADNYQSEFYHYLLSPTLWVDLLDVLHIENRFIPKAMLQITKLSYSELTDLFRTIIDDKIKGREKAIYYKII